jgi:NAD(P)-dependent dehydrogenase (short-subunit alcohol dehydrogenase family)
MSQSAILQYSKLFDLSGKTALVTGGAGILGVQFCAALAAHGANVALVDLEKTAAQEAAFKIQGNVVGFGCDVSDPESVGRLVVDVVKKFGDIHILHNNAATKSSDLNAFFAPFEEYSLSEWRKIMAVNLDGMFLVAQAVGAQMIKQKTGGSVIHTSSIYGIVAPDQRIYEGSEYMGLQINTPAVYAASKSGVLGLSRYLATYWASHGIRVNTLTPGGVESGQNKEFQKQYCARVPLGRMAQSLDMVGALIYLASDASRYVTGQNLVVDGGLTCW